MSTLQTVASSSSSIASLSMHALSLLAAAGSYVRSWNPSLLLLPPPPNEVTGQDVCYLGPNGEHDDGDAITLCSELVDGMRGVVGSWYLSPERHVVEYLLVTISSLSILRFVWPRLVRIPPSPSGDNPLRPAPFVRAITLLTFVLMITYKACGYPGKLWFVVMPCNALWCMALALSFYPNLSPHGSNVICQLWIGYSLLAIMAVANPDTADIVLPGEIYYFFGHHLALILIPLYQIASGRVTTLPAPGSNETATSCFVKWYLLTVAAFAFFYFGLVTPLSIFTGLNLNYMLSPPPTPGDILDGDSFRRMSAGMLAVMLFAMRLVVTTAEWTVRRVMKALGGGKLEVHAELASPRRAKKKVP